jgi:hypothetical protein
MWLAAQPNCDACVRVIVGVAPTWGALLIGRTTRNLSHDERDAADREIGDRSKPPIAREVMIGRCC